MNDKTATLRDVARAAGVSVASASRALSGGGVGAELQSRIEAAAKRLEYRANFAARALVSRRSGLVAVVLGSVEDSLLAEAVDALERRFCEAGYAMLLARRKPPGLDEASRPLVSHGAEAVVYVGTRPMASETELLDRESLPWVSVSDAPMGGRTFIEVGRQRGAALAARYLLDLGHRRFGVCAQAGPETRQGVATALVEGGGTLIGAAKGESGREPAEAPSPVPMLLDRDDPPTAIVCGTDLEALAVVRECALRGIHVPGEMSVVGFGDREFARHARPALTTVRVSAAEIGTHAGEVLLAALRGEPRPLVEVPVKLVVRETTGRVP